MSTQPTHPRRALRLSLLTCAAGLCAAVAVACSPAAAQPQVTLPSEPPVIIVADAPPPASAPGQSTTLAELRARAPFPIKTPAWVPAGYQLSDDINIAADSAWVLLEWQSPDGALVDLIISPIAPATPNAPPQFVHAVEVAGQPGQFIFGLHNSAAGRWDPTLQTLLTWQQDKLYYALATAGLTTSAQDLQRMADSMS
jgi:hypothetical protein